MDDLRILDQLGQLKWSELYTKLRQFEEQLREVVVVLEDEEGVGDNELWLKLEMLLRRSLAPMEHVILKRCKDHLF